MVNLGIALQLFNACVSKVLSFIIYTSILITLVLLDSPKSLAENGSLKSNNTLEDSYIITTTVTSGAGGWASAVENCKFYIKEGIVSQISNGGTGTSVTFSPETVTVENSKGVTKRYETDYYDPEVTSTSIELDSIYTLFFQDTKWLQYDEHIWESGEPIIIQYDNSVKRLKAWKFISEDTGLVDKITFIDEDNQMVDVLFSYDRVI